MAEPTSNLYGVCKENGKCECGMCEDIATNSNKETSPELYDCDVCGKMHMKGHNPHEGKPYVPVKKRVEKRCAVCNKVERTNHKCQGDRKPTGYPSLPEMDAPSPAVLAARAARLGRPTPVIQLPAPVDVSLPKVQNRAAEVAAVPRTEVTPAQEDTPTAEPVRKALRPETLPCQVCGDDVTLEDSEKITRRRAYCSGCYPEQGVKEKLTPVDKSSKRIVIEVGGVKITIESVDK